MSYIRKLNRKYDKMYDGQVAAHEDSGCLVLSGQLQRWSDVVHAGKLALYKSPYVGFINDIECTGEPAMPVRKPRIEDSALEWEEPDVLVIGGGVIGCAIARELSRYKLGVMLVEKEHDVAMQASGRNDGTIHSGYDLKKGSLKHKYCIQGNSMIETVCSELGVDFERTGQYLCYTNKLWEPFMFISLLHRKWLGMKGVKVVRGDELHSLEPALNHNIGTSLFFPTAGILNPIELTIAYAENAVQNGVHISLDTMVLGMVVEDNRIKSVKTNRGTIQPKVVVNAAGVFSDDIAELAGDRFFSIHPRKGTTVILDKKYTSSLVNSIISSFGKSIKKKKNTKGGAVRKTIHGSTLVGPDSVETNHKEDYSTNSLNVSEVLKRHSRIIPALDENKVISYYSGIRAATYEEDFIVSKGRYVTNIVHAAGIQSPGLTAAPAISADISKMVLEVFGGEDTVGINPEFNPVRSAPPRPSKMDDDARAALIESNPDYGILICRCEEISKGEIINAMRRNIRCDTVDAVKRRVRPGSGRCQGGFCGPQVLEIIAAEKRISPHYVKRAGSKSELLFGSSKTQMQKKAAAAVDRIGSLKLDPETEAKIRARANALLALSKRKDDGDDDNQ